MRADPLDGKRRAARGEQAGCVFGPVLASGFGWLGGKQQNADLVRGAQKRAGEGGFANGRVGAEDDQAARCARSGDVLRAFPQRTVYFWNMKTGDFRRLNP